MRVALLHFAMGPINKGFQDLVIFFAALVIVKVSSGPKLRGYHRVLFILRALLTESRGGMI